MSSIHSPFEMVLKTNSKTFITLISTPVFTHRHEFLTYCQKMERPHVLHIFLQSWYQDNQGTMRGQTLKGEKL